MGYSRWLQIVLLTVHLLYGVRLIKPVNVKYHSFVTSISDMGEYGRTCEPNVPWKTPVALRVEKVD